MAFVVEPDQRASRSGAPEAGGWLAVAGGASLGAGAVHAAAIGVHSEHRQAVITFTLVAAAQMAWGVLLLTRPRRAVQLVGAVMSLGVVVGWIVAKSSGISFIEGLEGTEAVQTADALAVALAVVAVLAVLANRLQLGAPRLTGSPLLTGGTALLVVALAVPGMISAGSHRLGVGAHGQTEAAAGQDVAAAVVPPKAFDPELPIDLGGVEGVTPQQQARAENLLAVTLLRLPQFQDPATAESMGFKSIGDGGLGHEHYVNPVNMNDDKLLDPDFPESLVYDTSVTPKRLAAAMYMLNAGDTFEDVPELGGRLTQWHVHGNLCFSGTRVGGLTDDDGNCPPGLTKGPETPMIHVWIEPNPCGPFAALEGIAGGTIPEGEERLCDQVHGA